MPEREGHVQAVRGIGSITAVAAAMILAGATTVLAIRHTRTLAIQRIADVQREARLLIDAANADALQCLDKSLAALAFASGQLQDLSDNPPPTGDSSPAWVLEVYAAAANGPEAVTLHRWRRSSDASAPWRREPVAPPPDGEVAVAVFERVRQTLLSCAPTNRPDSAQFEPAAGPQYDTLSLNGRLVVVASVASCSIAHGVSVVAAVVSSEQYARESVARKLLAGRIQVVSGPESGVAAGSHSWREPAGPLAPSLWLVPTPEFINAQYAVVDRQTLLFVTGTALAAAAFFALVWSRWRVFRREIGLSRMKQAFVADVSHELKTPLALIRMFGETLLDGRVADDAKRREYYEIIIRESTRLTNLINNILDFARIDAGKKSYNMERTDVGRLVADTYEAYRSQLDHDGFDHELQVAPDLPEVFCDRDAVAQAIINLINNAVKYADDDKFLGIRLSAETRRGKHGVLISVSDRGIGVRPEDRNRLFTDFYRADDERVRRRRGAGLGLALVRQIVDAHGGIVDVEPRLVKGSTFRIFLPQNEPPVSQETPSNGTHSHR